MNNLKSNPKGIDIVISKIQKKLYDTLSVLWDVELDGYGRCYTQKIDENRGIVNYVNSKEYSKSLIHKERNKFFFLAENEYKQTSLGYFSTSIELYFILNLNECKPDATDRQDEEVRVDVINALFGCFVKQDIKVTFVLEDVFRNYFYPETLDLHPYHCFKLVLPLYDFDINQELCSN